LGGREADLGDDLGCRVTLGPAQRRQPLDLRCCSTGCQL